MDYRDRHCPGNIAVCHALFLAINLSVNERVRLWIWLRHTYGHDGFRLWFLWHAAYVAHSTRPADPDCVGHCVVDQANHYKTLITLSWVFSEKFRRRTMIHRLNDL